MLGKPSTLCRLLLACCMAAQVAQLAMAAPTVAAAAAASAALATSPGGQLTVALQLEGDSAPSSLQLQRRDVWSPGAQVVVHTAAGVSHQAPPPTRWFAGSLAGVRGSSVMLAVHPDGRMSGTAARPGTSWSLTTAATGPTTAAAGSGRLVGHKLTNVTRPTTAAAASQRPSRRCGNKPRPVTVGQTTAAPVAAAATATQVDEKLPKQLPCQHFGTIPPPTRDPSGTWADHALPPAYSRCRWPAPAPCRPPSRSTQTLSSARCLAACRTPQTTWPCWWHVRAAVLRACLIGCCVPTLMGVLGG